MKKQYYVLCLAISLALFPARSLMANPVAITFNRFPGPDNIPGTGDDVPVTLVTDTLSGEPQARFTNEYAFISGGIGFTVDSLCCAAGEGVGLAAITSINGQDVLVQARPDITPTAFSLGSFGINLVTSVDGVTRTSVTSVDIRFTGDSAGTIDFFNARDDLRFRTAVPHEGSGNVLYSDADGISRIVFNGVGAVNLFEFDASAPLTAPPALESVPEAGTFGLTFAGMGLLIAGLARSPFAVPSSPRALIIRDEDRDPPSA